MHIDRASLSQVEYNGRIAPDSKLPGLALEGAQTAGPPYTAVGRRFFVKLPTAILPIVYPLSGSIYIGFFLHTAKSVCLDVYRRRDRQQT